MIRCPVCDSKVDEIWESSGGVNGSAWWSGLYTCRFCGHFRASGTERKGERWVVAWHPGCPTHGTEPVYQTDMEGKEWVCSACNRKMRQEGTKLVTTWQPYQAQVVDHSADCSLRLGGLPHD